jgi:hypothetical protein
MKRFFDRGSQLFTEDVILERADDGTPKTNVPQQIAYHSPTGFEWGYGGSGPADLALNTLLLFVSEKEAIRLHQDFKWDFITPMNREGGIIKNSEIRDWIDEYDVVL